VLEARGVSKSYGPVQALDGAALRIGAAEVVALAGENGSGKSTFVKILAGAVAPNAGEILVDGVPVAFSRPREALARGIALVTQEPTAVPELSIAENVLLSHRGRLLGHVSPRKLRERARPLLETVGVDVDPAGPFSSLGSGDRELVEIAKALASNPRLLILDEATSRLGERDVERVFDIVRRLRANGTSTLFITHRLREIRDHADRAVVLRDGRLVGELPREQLTDERLSSMMVGRELGQFFHKRDVAVGEIVLRVEGLLVPGAHEPVSLEVRAGEIVGLAGLVGCGRTELLETIAGLRRPHGGTITVRGRVVEPGSPRDALREGIALVPEDRHRQGLILDAPLRENIVMGSWKTIGHAWKSRERVLAEEGVQRLHVRAAGLEAPVRSLSGGNQQKVVLARGLARRPAVLLLDEPARGVDVGAKEELFRLIGEMLEAGLAVLFASSELLEILGLADRILVLHERCVVAELSREEATEERIVLISGGGGLEHHAA
jgi:rhamnose transport system ATP-binding protein